MRSRKMKNLRYPPSFDRVTDRYNKVERTSYIRLGKYTYVDFVRMFFAIKFKRTRTQRAFVVTFYWWVFKLKTFEFLKHFEGNTFVATTTRLDGYYMGNWSYAGHGRKFYYVSHIPLNPA